MEILSSQILNNSPSSTFAFWASLFGAGIFLSGGLYWIYEILKKKEKFSVGAIVFVVIGMFFAASNYVIFTEESYEIEQMKVIVTDWNVVYEEGWEVVDQDGKIVILERRVEGE